MPDWKYRPKERITGTDEEKEHEIKEQTPEGFASKNVKVITFVICITAFLLLFGPVTIFRLISHYSEKDMPGQAMTAETLLQIAERGRSLTMEDLQRYEGELSDSDERTYYYIQFDRYMILGVQNKETKRLDFCTLTDEKTSDTLDLMRDGTEALKEFLKEHGSR